MNITIEPGAAALLDALHRAGFAAYAVGGCVRDSLLGLAPHDWDLCTAARPEPVMELPHGNFLHLRRLLPCFQQIPDLLQQHLLCILSDLLYWYSFLSEYVRLR